MHAPAVLLVLASLASRAAGQPALLEPGSAAPDLAVTKWVKGAPINALEKGKTYLIEFFETGFRLDDQVNERVAPLLTSIARANSDVTVLAVDVQRFRPVGAPEPDVAGFVARLGDAIDYPVGVGQEMERTWMRAAAQDALPTSFLVKDGVVLWVGAPVEAGPALQELKAGTFDLASAKASFEKKAAVTQRKWAAREAMGNATALFAKKDYAGGYAALTKLEQDFPEMAARAEDERFTWLSREDPKAWEARARELATSGREEDRKTLLDFAVRLAKASPDLAKKALEIALETKADDFATERAAFEYYRVVGDGPSELKAIDALLARLPANPTQDDARFKAELERRKAELAHP